MEQKSLYICVLVCNGVSMSFNINRLFFTGQAVPAVSVNSQPPQRVRFDTNTPVDSFESTNPVRYTSEYMINKLASDNKQLQSILKSSGIPYRLNMGELNKLLQGHCTDTQRIAEGIVHNLPFALESKADIAAIKDAAYLHDIGKVFIPDEILNKTTKLTPQETEIVHKHPELGYELLKNTGINPKTLLLIRNHHQDAKKSGYPVVDKQFIADLDLQILSIADKYSALTEERAYKKAMSREQALTIIRADVRNGKINPLVYNALVNYTDETAMSPTKQTSNPSRMSLSKNL